jgi:HptB-dependent secretion and biofilm anti anti-sigma factor
MRIETKIKDNVFEAKLIDRFSFSDSQVFRKLIEEISASGKKQCVFDLSMLSHIDSAGLGMFVIARNAAKDKNWSLSIRGAQGDVKTLLKLGRFDELLQLQG